MKIPDFIVKNPIRDIVMVSVIFVWNLFYFSPISSPCLRQWDEARNAVNAQEMLQNGNLLVRHFHGSPDMYELKPPLLVWMQAGLMKISGMTEFSVRFPSALATLVFAILIIFILSRNGVSELVSVTASLLFLSIPALLQPHGFGYGDHDALLCLFQASFLYYFWKFLHSDKRRHLIKSAVFFLLGWMTKSIAIAFALPGLLLFILFIPQFRKKLFNLQFIFVYAIVFALIFLYYLIREKYSPGYFALVQKEEWFGRYNREIAQPNDLWYYWRGLKESRAGFLLIPGIIGIIRAFVRIKKAKFETLCAFIFITILPILSFSHNKNFWYDLPLMFPLLICAVTALDALFSLYKGYRLYHASVPVLICILLAYYSTKKGYGEVAYYRTPVIETKKEMLVKTLKEKKLRSGDFLGIYCDDHTTDIEFYTNRSNGRAQLITNRTNLNRYTEIILVEKDQKAWEEFSATYLLGPTLSRVHIIPDSLIRYNPAKL